MEQLLTELNTVLDSNQINIIIEYNVIEKRYIFKLKHNEIIIGTLHATISESTIFHGITRTRENIDIEAINIIGLYIHENYQGFGLGQLLLVYGLIYIIKGNPDVKWSVLDDDSNLSDKIRNIYARFGYVSSDLTELIDNETIRLNGPEKQMDIEYFLSNKEHIIKRVIEKIKSFPSIGGKGIKKTKSKRKHQNKKTNRKRNQNNKKKQYR